MNVGIWLTATGQLQQDMATNTNKGLISNIGLALDIMNAVCQVIMAIAAIIAIIITIKQIQLRRKSDLRVSYTCGMGAIDRDDKLQIVVGASITLRNIGFAPVYYDNCGLMFVRDRKVLPKKNYPGIMAMKSVGKQIGVLQPGESACESIHMLEDLLQCVNNDHPISENEKVYIFIELCNGKRFYWDTGDTYKNLLDKYNQVKQKHEQLHMGKETSKLHK